MNPARGSGLEIRAEPYDGAIARGLVEALSVDIEVRYADDPDDPDPAAHWRVSAEQVTPPRGLFVVAYIDGKPVGCGAFRPLPVGRPHVAEIKRMYTTPQARRRGVSRALVARLESEAARSGYRWVQLETGRRQPEAMALYQSAGYHRIPPYGEYRDDQLSVCYAKNLDPVGAR